jgi:UDP-N-acetylglucosamine:LPS N-acetylglucosamine transferase
VKLKKNNSDVLRVVIVTTTISGGNHAVAESMAHYLAKNKHMQIFLIDVEDIAKDIDPLMVTTGVYTYDKTYSGIFQKTNDYSALIERKKLNREIQQYIPSVLLSKLKQKIAAINPDLIISARSYTSDDLALSSLGIPLRLFHPDFEICPSLCAYYRSVPDSIRFWLPAFNASIFKPLFKKHNKLEIYDENDSEEALLNKISHFLGISPRDFKKQFEVIGYPCSNFFPIKESEKLELLRQKWGIAEKDIPVFVVMGKHGANLIKEIMDRLLAVKSKLPLKYVFICGKNSELVDELKDKIYHLENDKSRFIVHGLLKPEEMNEVMNLSSLGISKAGGATVVESIMTRCPLILMHSYPWEEVNAAYLIDMGLATRYDPSKDLVSQIESFINKFNVSEKSSEVENWREQLDFYIEEFIKNKKES